MKRLFTEDGKKAGLREVCEWWIATYPEIVFVNEPKEVTLIRSEMKKIVKKLEE